MKRIDEIKKAMTENSIPFSAVKYLPNNPSGMKDFPRGWVYKREGEKVWRILGKNAEEAMKYIKKNVGDKNEG